MGLYGPVCVLAAASCLAAQEAGSCAPPKEFQTANDAGAWFARQGNYRFSFVENFQGSTPVEYVYTYRLGNTFTYATDPDKLFKAHGIPADDPRAATVITAELFAASGFSTVNKTEGMLIIQRNLTKPMVYARCDG